MDQHTEQHTSVGGRFIAGFAAAGITLALIVSMWSIRSADSAENKAHKTIAATTQDSTTASTKQPKPESKESSTAPETPWQPVASDTAVMTNDPYLPPYALSTPQNGNGYPNNTYVPQPTTKWLAEAGKAPTQQQVVPQPETTSAAKPTPSTDTEKQDWNTFLPWVPSPNITLPPLPPLPTPEPQPQPEPDPQPDPEEPAPRPTETTNPQAPRSTDSGGQTTE